MILDLFTIEITLLIYEWNVSDTYLIAVNMKVPKRLGELGLSQAKSDRIVREMGNQYLSYLEAHIPAQIARKNNVNVTGFKKARKKKNRITARGRSAGVGTFWIGENDVAARFKKGAWRQTSEGARKGTFFKKDAFILKFKSGYKSMFTHRKGGDKLFDEVRAPLFGYIPIVNKEMDNARRSVEGVFKKEVELELFKRGKK